MKIFFLISFIFILSTCVSYPDEKIMDKEFWLEFRDKSSLNNSLFVNVYGKEGGVISFDQKIFPVPVKRDIVKIVTIKPFDIFQGGQEKCHVRHENGFEVEYLVNLNPNGSYWIKWAGDGKIRN